MGSQAALPRALSRVSIRGKRAESWGPRRPAARSSPRVAANSQPDGAGRIRSCTANKMPGSRAPDPGTRVQGDGRSASAARPGSLGRALRVPAGALCVRSCARRKARKDSRAEALFWHEKCLYILSKEEVDLDTS